MKLSNRILQRLDMDRVRRINEIYHNLENAGYDRLHEDIARFESRFWKEAAERYIDKGKPLTWLDYGTGTGFVPLVISQHLKAEDILVCCDISDEMLGVCRAKLKDRGVPCRCLFERIDGTAIPVGSQSVDILSVNSVLHHLFDLSGFVSECRRVLKPGALVIVAHEPNIDAGLSPWGRLVRASATGILRPRTMVFRAAEWSPVIERLLRAVTSRISPKYRRRNQMLAEVARQIRQEGLLGFDLRGTEIQQIVDFQSQRGFARDELLGRVFDRFALLEFRTYGHLGFFPAGKMARAVDRYLRTRWPDAGREVCFVLRWPSNDGS